MPIAPNTTAAMNPSQEVHSIVATGICRQGNSVHFRTIEIIEMAIVLGDNPSLSTGGPPMSLGWETVRRSEFELDFYEECRPKRKESRRALIISKKSRTKFFERCGYSKEEIDEAAAVSLNYRKQMTITKLLEPPTTMKDAANDRFASSHESEIQSTKSTVPRTRSCDTLQDVTSQSPRQYSSNDDPLGPSPYRMPRKLSDDRLSSEYEKPRNRILRRLSNFPLVAPTRLVSPLHGHLRRPNHTMADSISISSGMLSSPSQRWSSEEPMLDTKRYTSPDRGNEERRPAVQLHHSTPMTPYQPLRLPVRTTSPMPLFCMKVVQQSSQNVPLPKMHGSVPHGSSLIRRPGDGYSLY